MFTLEWIPDLPPSPVSHTMPVASVQSCSLIHQHIGFPWITILTWLSTVSRMSNMCCVLMNESALKELHVPCTNVFLWMSLLCMSYTCHAQTCSYEWFATCAVHKRVLMNGLLHVPCTNVFLWMVCYMCRAQTCSYEWFATCAVHKRVLMNGLLHVLCTNVFLWMVCYTCRAQTCSYEMTVCLEHYWSNSSSLLIELKKAPSWKSWEGILWHYMTNVNPKVRCRGGSHSEEVC